MRRASGNVALLSSAALSASLRPALALGLWCAGRRHVDVLNQACCGLNDLASHVRLLCVVGLRHQHHIAVSSAIGRHVGAPIRLAGERTRRVTLFRDV